MTLHSFKSKFNSHLQQNASNLLAEAQLRWSRRRTPHPQVNYCHRPGNLPEQKQKSGSPTALHTNDQNAHWADRCQRCDRVWGRWAAATCALSLDRSKRSFFPRQRAGWERVVRFPEHHSRFPHQDSWFTLEKMAPAALVQTCSSIVSNSMMHGCVVNIKHWLN